MTPLALLLLGASAARAAAFAPYEPLRFDASPGELSADCADAVRRAGSALDEVVRLPASARTFDDTVWALDRVVYDLADQTAAGVLLARASPEPAVREAARACDARVARFAAELYGREDLARAVREYAAKGEPLTGEDARLLTRTALDFHRAGLDLPAEKRTELAELRRRIAAREADFLGALAAAPGSVALTRARLYGLPDALVAEFPRPGDRWEVPLDSATYARFMEHARDPEARRLVERAFDDRAAEANRAVLAETLELRRRAARLLGYPSHADYVAELGTARAANTVGAFLSRLRRRLTPLAREELADLLALKRATEGRASDGRLHEWDRPFYDALLRRAKYLADEDAARAYFPADLVVERALGLFEKSLGLRFRDIPGAVRWHPDVKLYEVSDAAGGAPLGWFYLDLYAREAAAKPARPEAAALVAGRRLTDGTFRRPVSAVLASFDPPSARRPSLLRRGDVAALLHELGLVLAQTLSRAKYGRFSGWSVARDILDVPARTFESWARDPAVLRALSGRADDRSRPLPDERVAALLAADRADAALAALRQVFFSSVDQLCHGARPPSDLARAYARLAREIALVPVSDGTHPEASFAHLMDGGDGAYYGYLWSQVLAADAAAALGSGDPAAGRRFRAEVLERGAARDELDSLKAFLGRAPNEDAYARALTPDTGEKP